MVHLYQSNNSNSIYNIPTQTSFYPQYHTPQQSPFNYKQQHQQYNSNHINLFNNKVNQEQDTIIYDISSNQQIHPSTITTPTTSFVHYTSIPSSPITTTHKMDFSNSIDENDNNNSNNHNMSKKRKDLDDYPSSSSNSSKNDNNGAFVIKPVQNNPFLNNNNNNNSINGFNHFSPLKQQQNQHYQQQLQQFNQTTIQQPNLILLNYTNNFSFQESNNNNNNLVRNQKSINNKRHQFMNSEGSMKYSSQTNDHNDIVKELSTGEMIKKSLIPNCWREVLGGEFNKPYFKSLLDFIEMERESGWMICPNMDEIFKCFNLTPYNNVKIVIIGQDPPHGTDQANGLSFSIGYNNNNGNNNNNSNIEKLLLNTPLSNIYKELQNDLGVCKSVKHGSLDKWAKQGVLLLNTCLTVRKGAPESHNQKGWEKFTDFAIETISKHHSGVIFLLWGKNAQEKAKFIDNEKHTILSTSYPSTFSVSKGFFGCKHFSSCNNILMKLGKTPIDWDLDTDTIQIPQNRNTTLNNSGNTIDNSNNNNNNNDNIKNSIDQVKLTIDKIVNI